MTNATSAARLFGDAPLLGARPKYMRSGGRIRAGVQVLSAEAEMSAIARAIYAEGVAADIPFGAVADRIRAAVPSLSEPLTAGNVPYFSVHSYDFPNPEVARQLLTLYGEDRGEGPQLYRFPVLFAADDWQSNIPHQLVMWEDRRRKYWSEYSSDGATRLCMTPQSPPPVAASGRPLRTFGGRAAVLRSERGGACDPLQCPEYQARTCNLSGRFLVYVPGVTSIAPIEIRTGSFLSVSRAIGAFTDIARARNGRVSGYLDAQRTPFYMRKVLEQFKWTTDEGRVEFRSAWIITVDAPIDVAELLFARDDDVGAVRQAGDAVRLLEPSRRGDESTGTTGSAPLALEMAGVPRGGPMLSDIEPRLRALGVDPAQYQKYADRRFGAGWKLNPNGRRRVLADIETYSDNPAVLHEILAGEAA